MKNHSAREGNNPILVVGNKVTLREASLSDAHFMYTLRNLESTRKGLPNPPSSIENQSLWLEEHLERPDEYYFLITEPGGERWGSIRLYGVQSVSFTWGSWALLPAAPASLGLESNLLIYHFARQIGLEEARFEVLTENESVWRFHERLGAVFVREDDGFRHYSHNVKTIDSMLQRFKSIFPEEVEVQLPLSPKLPQRKRRADNS